MVSLSSWALRSTPKHQYAVAITATALALVVRVAIDPLLGDHLPYVTFFCAIALSAWYGTVGPALMAVALGAVSALWFFMPPRYTFTIVNITQSVGFATYFLVSSFIVGFCQAWRSARQQAEHEIDQRKAMESVLRESEERLRKAFQLASVGKAQVSVQTKRLVEVNDAYCRMTGFTREELLTMTPADITHPDDRQSDCAAFSKLLIGERDQYRVEKRYVTKHGKTIWVQVEVGLIRDLQGHPRETIAVILDITEQKHAIAALRKSEEDLQQSQRDLTDFFDNATVALHWLGADGIIQRVNDAELNMLGYTREEYVGRHIQEFHVSTPVINDILARLVRGETVLEQEAQLRCKDGSIRDVLINSSGLFRDSHFVHSRCWTLDITERKRAEAALRASEERWQLAITGSTDGIWDWDITNHTFFFSARWKALRGYQENEVGVQELEWSSRIHPDDLTRVLKTVHRYLDKQIPTYECEYRTRCKDGSYLWVVARGVALWDVEGRPKRMVGSESDITDRKLSEEALRKSEEELRAFAARLEELVKERTKELSYSQDRLRALAKELNLAEHKERQRIAIELHDHLQQLLVLGKMKVGQAKRSTGQAAVGLHLLQELDEVISEALQYTRTLVAELAPPVLHQFGLPAALKWLGQWMQRHNLAVTVEVHESHDPLPEDRAVLMFQSVRELLINAAKHARCREVHVAMTQDNMLLRIQVRDDGVGFNIAASDGTSSSKEDAEISAKFGLFSIRERMKALGGRLEVRSAIGKGTTAVLELPIECGFTPLSPELTRQDSNAAETLHSMSQSVPIHNGAAYPIRVLLVDDHRLFRHGLRRALESYADIAVVGEAGDGEEAIRAVEALHPSVVVIDINMPRKNGIDATAVIKGRHPQLAIIGLSVNAGEETQAAMKKAGAAMLLSKEAAIEHLYDAIEQALHPA